MKKVYQKIVDPGNGDCWKCAIASLLDMEYEDVPHFLEYGKHSFSEYRKLLKQSGYKETDFIWNRKALILDRPTMNCFENIRYHRPSIITPKKLFRYSGVNGLFYATVYSPKYFTMANRTTHAVIIDRDFNIVHDPNPGYENIIRYPLSELIGYNGIRSISIIEKI